MNHFKVGERVWTLDGWGTILDVRLQYKLQLDSGSILFYREHELFFHELDIPESARTRPEPRYEFKAGDPVIVWDNDEPGDKRLIAFPHCLERDYAFSWDNCVLYDRALLGFDLDPRDLPEGTEIEVSDNNESWYGRRLIKILANGHACAWNVDGFPQIWEQWRLPEK